MTVPSNSRYVGPRRVTLALLLVTVAVVSPASGRANAPVCFYGPHPLAPGVWDTTQGLHVAASTGAATPDEIADVDGVLVFIGDPLIYGYPGDSFTFEGMHPLPGGIEGYCDREGPHRHAFAPDLPAYVPREARAELVYRYAGPLQGGRPSFTPRRRVEDLGPLVASSGAPVVAPAYPRYDYGGFPIGFPIYGTPRRQRAATPPGVIPNPPEARVTPGPPEPRTPLPPPRVPIARVLDHRTGIHVRVQRRGPGR